MRSESIHLVIPMSGQGTRFQAAGYKDIKPLIRVNGRPIIERLLAVFPEHWPSHFVYAENHLQTPLPELLRKLRPNGNQFTIPVARTGPAAPTLEALKNIPPDAPVLVSYCDYGMSWDPVLFEEFVLNSGCDACVISYKGFHAHYRSSQPYAYCRMDGERVVEVREKGWFTEDREQEFASCGAYYFRSASILADAIAKQKEYGLYINDELYISLTVEALLRSNPNAHVRVFEIPGFYQWGTPADLQEHEYWEMATKCHSRYLGQIPQFDYFEVDNILMPMAGLGSRFRGITTIPKPFIPLHTEPMFASALKTLPRARNATTIVALEEHQKYFEFLKPRKHAELKLNFAFLDETPPGQALSVEMGLKSQKLQGDIVISSCDHGIVLNPKIWQQFKKNPDCDAAIFTMKGYPGAARKPKSYAWVVPAKGSETFPRVERVGVKEQVSESPINDHVLVGTFWFKNQEILQKGIELLKTSKIKVNNEVYLDSVFDLLQQQGHTVRQIPLDGYLCWGDPDSLAEALYWQELFLGHRLDRRPRFPGVPV